MLPENKNGKPMTETDYIEIKSTSGNPGILENLLGHPAGYNSEVDDGRTVSKLQQASGYAGNKKISTKNKGPSN